MDDTTDARESGLIFPEQCADYPFPLPHVAIYGPNFELVYRVPTSVRWCTTNTGGRRFDIDGSVSWTADRETEIKFIELAVCKNGKMVRGIINHYYTKVNQAESLIICGKDRPTFLQRLLCAIRSRFLT